MSCGMISLFRIMLLTVFFIAKPDAVPWLGASHLSLKVFLLCVQRVFAQP